MNLKVTDSQFSRYADSLSFAMQYAKEEQKDLFLPSLKHLMAQVDTNSRQSTNYRQDIFASILYEFHDIKGIR